MKEVSSGSEQRLNRSFFSRYAPEAAQELLGCILVRRIDAKTLSRRIVEVEAYREGADPASDFPHVLGR